MPNDESVESNNLVLKNHVISLLYPSFFNYTEILGPVKN